MNKILISIKPQWCQKIFSGEKTIEVRKTAPKLETPFKVYVYCTKQKLTKKECMHSYLHKNEPKACKKYGEITTWCSIGDVHVNSNTPWSFRSYGMHGKVIGEFVCDKITCCQAYYGSSGEGHLTNLFGIECKRACLSEQELFDYITGNGGKMGTGWLWHITEPQLFEKPKLLSDFYIPCKWYEKGGNRCPEDCGFFKQNGIIDRADDFCEGKRPITRPPQSWAYIEEYNAN